ncbi:hypothetical protein ILUMI_14458 [Ignelater luminosus]|uniref:RING-type E3 ubiquitin transferase n=1 Tax=Ignelater luminosus TaxID=2038154 RepID=A0A8K0CYL9_IGNLU|nr:hypothetical protein ILUMI_14458 [Ignelater luminosus]
MLLKHVGNICEDCVRSEKTETLMVRNLALETVLENLEMPCRNTNNGCQERLDYFDMLTHDLICTFKYYTCPTRLVTNCNWKGSFTDIAVHAATDHQDLAVKGYNNYFPFNIAVFDTDETIRILYINDECFVLHIRCDVFVKQLRCIMYYIENKEEKASDILYTIIQTHSNNINDFSHKIFSYKKDYTYAFDEERAVTIDLLLHTSNLNAFTVALKNPEIDDKILKHLECVVCNYLIKPPIYQCSVGHSMCNTCLQKLQKCPLCQARYIGTRNFTLEALCEDIRFPCTYRTRGCRANLLLTELERHESACLSKPFVCPLFRECVWMGSLCKHEAHLKLSHRDKLIFNSYNKTHIKISTTENILEMYCMITYGRIFRVCHKQSMETKTAYWVAQVRGKTDEKETYRYEVGLLHNQNKQKHHIKSDICLRSFNNKNIFARSITFSSEDISLFSFNDGFTCYCKISRATVEN